MGMVASARGGVRGVGRERRGAWGVGRGAWGVGRGACLLLISPFAGGV